MKSVFVAYDLNKPGQDYSGLISALKTFPAWCRPLESSWVIRTPLSALAVRDFLLPTIDRGDELLVIEITGADWASWLSADVNNWLTGNLAA